MPQYPDTIRGSFTRETFALHRKSSECSIHRHNSIKSSDPCLDHRGTDCNSCEHPQEKVSRFNKSFHHYRFVIAFLGGFAVGFMSLLRLNITVAILNMVNQTQIYLEEHDLAELSGYFGEDYVEVGEFDWDNEIQQQIISYYMIAYTLPQLLTTKLAIKIGIRWSMPISIGICAFSCLLTPIMAYHGWQYVMILRLINGLGASAILPMMVYALERWLPARESSIGLAIVQFVQSILFTCSPLISGALAEIHWKWAFYVPALAAILFCLVWLCLVSDGPDTCWLVSQVELDMMCGCNNFDKSVHIISSGNQKEHQLTDKFSLVEKQAAPPGKVSWTKALRIKSFYALAFVWIVYNSSFGSLSFLLPIYMRQVLKVTIIENGMLCFIIQFGCMTSVIWPQPLLHLFQRTFQLSLTTSRRIIYSLISMVAITTWLLVAHFHQYQVVLFSINRIFHLSMDTIVTATIMSQYSKAGVGSIVYSVINAIGNLSTVFFCMAVGEFLDISGQSIECWSYVFIAMSLMNICAWFVFSTAIKSDPIQFEPGSSGDVEKHAGNY